MVTGQPAPSAPRVLLVEGGAAADVFELVELADQVVLARSPYRFELGEQLTLRIERDGGQRDLVARVAAHRDDGVTELELP